VTPTPVISRAILVDNVRNVQRVNRQEPEPGLKRPTHRLLRQPIDLPQPPEMAEAFGLPRTGPLRRLLLTPTGDELVDDDGRTSGSGASLADVPGLSAAPLGVEG